MPKKGKKVKYVPFVMESTKKTKDLTPNLQHVDKFKATKKPVCHSENTLDSNIMDVDTDNALPMANSSDAASCNQDSPYVGDKASSTQINTSCDDKSITGTNRVSTGSKKKNTNSRNEKHVPQHHNTRVKNTDQKNLKSAKDEYTEKNSSVETKSREEKNQHVRDDSTDKSTRKKDSWNNSQSSVLTNPNYSETDEEIGSKTCAKSEIFKTPNIERKQGSDKHRKSTKERNAENFTQSEQSSSRYTSERHSSRKTNKGSDKRNKSAHRSKSRSSEEGHHSAKTSKSNNERGARNRSQSGRSNDSHSSETKDNWEDAYKGTDKKNKSTEKSTRHSSDKIHYNEKGNKSSGDGCRPRNPRSGWSKGNYSSERKTEEANTSDDEKRSINVRASDRKINDVDYDIYSSKYMHNKEMVFEIVNEVNGDLFLADDEYALGHCVAEDMNMGSGIATTFRQMFKRVDELLNQRKSQGQLAVLEFKNRFIYYLVTKRESSGKPTYYTLWSSLLALKIHIITHDVKKLALPRLGCGLDRLEWDCVKRMLEYIFQGVDLEIKIFNFQQDIHALPMMKSKKCPVVNESYPISQIAYGTVILYFGSEDGVFTAEIEQLCEKFIYIRSYYRTEQKQVGTYIRTDKYSEGFVFYGCIVRKKHTDLIDFTYLQKCINAIQKQNRKDMFKYVAFQAFEENGDILTTLKIVNLVRNSLTYVEVYVCWPENLQNQKPISYNH